MTLPLADITIVSVEQFGAGPWGTLQLADLGAEVIKIEDPFSKGDVGRYVPPVQEGEDSLFFETFNRHKKSVSLDLRHERAREVFHDIVRNVDGVSISVQTAAPDPVRKEQPDRRPDHLRRPQPLADGDSLQLSPQGFLRFRLQAEVRDGERLPGLGGIRLVADS